MTRPQLLALVVLALPTVGCAPPKPDTYGEFQAQFEEFVKPGADRRALTAKLRPTKADYEAVFEPEFAAKLEALHSPEWEAGTTINPETDRFKLYWVTTDELKAPQSPLQPGIPEQYVWVADKLKPGFTIYAVEILDGKKREAQRYSGFIKVNGNWRFFRKIWLAK